MAHIASIDTSEMGVIFVHSAVDDLGLSPHEFRVYAHVARRASGGTAYPGIDSMAAVCRMNKKTVIASIKGLIDRRMLVVVKESGKTNRYHLTKPSEWVTSAELGNGEPDPKEVTHPTQIEPRTSAEIGNAPPPKEVTKGNPLKVIQENTSVADATDALKKTVSKKVADPRHHEFKTKWEAAYLEVRGETYFFQGGKDASAISRLIGFNDFDMATAIRLAKSAWKHADLFYSKHSMTIAGFVSQFNNIRGELRQTWILEKTNERNMISERVDKLRDRYRNCPAPTSEMKADLDQAKAELDRLDRSIKSAQCRA
jgi:hypothetical protein